MPYYIKRYPKKKKDGVEKKPSRRGKPNLVKKLDRVFALYIRLRDAMDGGYCRCISCGRIKPFAEIDCGHYHSRTHMATRYDEDNCHGECHYCNRMSADHLIKYRENLVKKIGQQKVDWLNVKAHSTKHFLDSELEGMIEYYTREAKKLSSLKGIRVNL